MTPLPDDATQATAPAIAPTPWAVAVDRPGWRRDTFVFLTSQTISLALFMLAGADDCGSSMSRW